MKRITSWRELVDQLNQRIGIDPEVVQALNEVKGRLTTPIFSNAPKSQVMKEYAEKHNIPFIDIKLIKEPPCDSSKR